MSSLLRQTDGHTDRNTGTYTDRLTEIVTDDSCYHNDDDLRCPPPPPPLSRFWTGTVIGVAGIFSEGENILGGI